MALIMVDGLPDPSRFTAVVATALDGIRLRRGAQCVRVFGEITDLLWREGSSEAALRLEALWNDLGATRPGSLLWAHTMASSFRSAGVEREDADERVRSMERTQTELERTNLLMQAPVATAMSVGPDHLFELANPAYCAMVGHDVIGKTYLEAFPELVGTPLPGILDRVFQTAGPFVTDEMLASVDRDGKRVDRFFNFNLVALRNVAGQIYGVMAVAVDVTDQVRARRELETNELQLRTMVDSMPALAWTARADGWIDFYNRRWYEYTGTSPEDMEGWGWQSVQHPDELPRVLERWNASIQTGEAFEMTIPLRAADGTFRWHLTRAVPIRDSAGEIVRWFGTNTDIDDQLRAEQQLAEANRINETLHRIGSVLNAELELDKLVQTLTNEATATVSRRVRRVLLQRPRWQGQQLHALHARGRSSRGVLEVSHAACDCRVRTDVQGRGCCAARRRDAGSALREERAVPRHA